MGKLIANCRYKQRREKWKGQYPKSCYGYKELDGNQFFVHTLGSEYSLVPSDANADDWYILEDHNLNYKGKVLDLTGIYNG